MSENKKHTPGPWHFAPDVSRQGARLIYGPDRYLIADAGRIYGRSEEETTANARLIAKSPELLALVERFAFIAEAMPKPEIGQWNWPQLAAEARALIAAVNV